MTSLKTFNMAEGGEIQQVRQEWHELLLGLKGTVDGLLATQSTNVWNTYGGLDRMSNAIEKILNHRLKVTQGPYGSVLDYWHFVLGLRWLHPVLAPSVDAIHRSSRAKPGSGNGRTWVRDSLMRHGLSSQLKILVGNTQHLKQHYYDDGFLCQGHYFQAMVICLQAVEQNQAALLAEINPTLLLHAYVRKKRIRPKTSHVRSASLPVNQVSESIMIRRTNTHDRLAPPMLSPKTESLLNTSEEYAIPSIASSPESAKDALLQVLSKSGETVDPMESYSFYDSYNVSNEKLNDPLMNLEIYHSSDFSIHSRRASTSGVIRTGIHGAHVASNPSCSEKENINRQNNKNKVNSNIDQANQADILDQILNNDSIPNTDILSSRTHFMSGSNMDLTDCPQETDQNIDQWCPEPSMTGQQTKSACRSQSVHQDCMSSQWTSKDSGLSSLHAGDSQVSSPTNGNPRSSHGKKISHVRSMSDYGLPNRRNADMDCGASSQNAETASLSSSLPTRQGALVHGVNSQSGYFPRPAKGQSLLSFLSSQDFHTCAELDKENAHFSISEALIAAIEQMKWNQVIRPQIDTEHEEGDSDEEIQELKQRIRIRRRERMKEKARGFPAFSDGRTDTTMSTTTGTTSTSYTTTSDEEPSKADSSSSGEIHDTEVTDVDASESTESNLTTLKESGLSLSLASMYSEIELQRALQAEKVERQSSMIESSSSHFSAESVAISLLKRFSEKHLPKASDLEWLVSEQDAPQALLPLPNSYPISPDDSENADLNQFHRTRIRGNLEWAPPRPQIVFNIHPPPKRKVVLAKQNYRCAGCGAKVEPGYMKRYRYCEYLGKFFCPRCHTNTVAFIPGRILRKWDFTKYYVSNFAYDILTRMFRDPLFNVEDINPSLYRKNRILDQVRESRQQLVHLRVFLQTCRNGQQMFDKLEKCPGHWTRDIHVYSLAELCKIKSNEMLPQLKCLVNDSIAHVSQCPLCQAKGFICELCNNHRDIFFPFELQRVTQCPVCCACYHKACYIPDKCPKCARIEARRNRLAAQAIKSDDEQDDHDDNGNR